MQAEAGDVGTSRRRLEMWGRGQGYGGFYFKNILLNIFQKSECKFENKENTTDKLEECYYENK